jgi:hypothetical protein
MTLLRPYGLSALRRVVSGIGISGGTPYTVADDEYTMRVHPNSDMTWHSVSVAPTLFW